MFNLYTIIQTKKYNYKIFVTIRARNRAGGAGESKVLGPRPPGGLLSNMPFKKKKLLIIIIYNH